MQPWEHPVGELRSRRDVWPGQLAPNAHGALLLLTVAIRPSGETSAVGYVAVRTAQQVQTSSKTAPSGEICILSLGTDMGMSWR